jgi:hypothetical protein
MIEAFTDAEIDALAAAFSDPVSARQLLEVAGLDRARHPVWDGGMIPLVFWREINFL